MIAVKRPENPFRPGGVAFSVMEMALQGEFDGLPGTDDLTVSDMADVLGVGRGNVYTAIEAIEKRTGYIVPYIKSKRGRKRVEW